MFVVAHLCKCQCVKFERDLNTTSQVFDEVVQLHLPLRFDIGAVHVCVEEDDGKS